MAQKKPVITDEIVAAITAAIEMMLGKKVKAVSIKRSDAWIMAARRESV